MERKTKIFLIISAIIILIGIAIAGGFYYFKTGGTPKPSEAVFSGTQLEESEQCFQVDYDKTYRFGNNTEDFFYQIAEAIALEKKSFCSEGDDSDKQKLCLVSYYKILGLRENVKEYWDNLAKIDSAAAFVGYAFLDKDLAKCESIQGDEIRKTSCRAVVSLDPSLCFFEKQNDINTGACLGIAGSDNPSVGCLADSVKAKSLCLNSVYLAQSLKDRDINNCSKIDDQSGTYTRLFCLAALSPEPKKEINEFYRKYECLQKYTPFLAKYKNDPALCENIPAKDSFQKKIYEECISQF